MRKIKVFISSVQTEFASERQMLFSYLLQDALLGHFFEPFIFENLPATDQRTDKLYINEVQACDIYIGLFGKEYGSEDKKGISPTEHEFNTATKLNKTRLVFLSQHKINERHPKEQLLIRKAEKDLVRKKFTSEIELKTAIYSSLIRFLVEKEYIRTEPFDASICFGAKMEDLAPEKIAEFVRIAKTKRGFPLSAQAKPEKILTHLNLISEGSISNAAVLLFGVKPQHFLISSEIKCVQFNGTKIEKPFPAYQVYKGDVFQLVNQAVDFVLSRIDLAVGTRNEDTQAPLKYEIPRAVIAEAIVNAIAHRDYNSTGSVQVMLFRDRIEIWNPGQLPHNLSLAKLKLTHSSFPTNPLIAEPLYLTGYIERLGTGIPDMINLSIKAGLREPDFKQDDVFKTIIWRHKQVTEQVTEQVTGQVTEQVSETIRRIVLVMSGEVKRIEIQDMLELKHRENFIENYLNPAIKDKFIELTIPDKPNSPKQKYRLTEKGIALKSQMKQRKRKK